jgi:hypothetical protein
MDREFKNTFKYNFMSNTKRDTDIFSELVKAES